MLDAARIFAESCRENRLHLISESLEELLDLSTGLPCTVCVLGHQVHRDGQLQHLRDDQERLVLLPRIGGSAGRRQSPGLLQPTAQQGERLLGEGDAEAPDQCGPQLPR